MRRSGKRDSGSADEEAWTGLVAALVLWGIWWYREARELGVGTRTWFESMLHELEFLGGSLELAAFPNQQVFDFAGLRGRLMSSSYAPQAGQPGHEPLLAELRALFEHYQRGGRITFPYQTLVYFAPLKPPR